MKLIIFSFLLIFSYQVNAQYITGQIVDATSKEPLIAASIWIKGTGKGTITNAEGAFFLENFQTPATLIISYVGYKTDTVLVPQSSGQKLNLILFPMDVRLAEVNVYANEDPAYNIIRMAILAKSDLKKGLKSFEFSSYSKNWMKVKSQLAYVHETFYTGVKETGKPAKEFVQSMRKTENIKERTRSPVSLNSFSDLTEDVVKIDNVIITLPLHPNTFDYYDFKLVATRMEKEKEVYQITVIPKSKIIPLVQGEVWIDNESYALVYAKLNSNDGIKIPFLDKLDLQFQQRFSNYSGYWIPQFSQFEINVEVNVAGLISLDPISIYSEYTLTEVKPNIIIPANILNAKRSIYGGYTADTSVINKPLPVFKRRKRQPDPNRISFQPSEAPKELSADSISIIRPVPLTDLEIIAFKELDSSKTMDQLIKPKGALSGMVTVGSSNGPREKSWYENFSYSKLFKNNRVEGPTITLFSEHDPWNSTYFGSGGIGYSFFQDKMQVIGTIGINISEDELDRMKLSAWHTTLPFRHPSETNDPILFSTITHTLLSTHQDHYVHSVGFDLHYQKYFQDSLYFYLNYRSDTYAGLQEHKPFSIFNQRLPIPINPQVSGTDRRISFIGVYGGNPYDYSGNSLTNGIRTRLTWSDPILGSEFGYREIVLTGKYGIKTMYPELFIFPNLTIWSELKTIMGYSPRNVVASPQNSLDVFTTDNDFRGLSLYELSGENSAIIIFHHNFRNVPFMWLGWDWPAKKLLGIGIHFKSAHVWNHNGQPILNYDGQGYFETGASLNGIFGVGKIEWTINRYSQHYVTLGITNLF